MASPARDRKPQHRQRRMPLRKKTPIERGTAPEISKTTPPIRILSGVMPAPQAG